MVPKGQVVGDLAVVEEVVAGCDRYLEGDICAGFGEQQRLGHCGTERPAERLRLSPSTENLARW